MAVQTSFAKKVAGSQNGDYGFLSLLGNHGELELAFLNIENRVRGVALRENDLILLIFPYRLSLTDFAEKFLGIKRELALLCHEDLRWPDDGTAKRLGDHTGFKAWTYNLCSACCRWNRTAAERLQRGVVPRLEQSAPSAA